MTQTETFAFINPYAFKYRTGGYYLIRNMHNLLHLCSFSFYIRPALNPSRIFASQVLSNKMSHMFAAQPFVLTKWYSLSPSLCTCGAAVISRGVCAWHSEKISGSHTAYQSMRRPRKKVVGFLEFIFTEQIGLIQSEAKHLSRDQIVDLLVAAPPYAGNKSEILKIQHDEAERIASTIDPVILLAQHRAFTMAKEVSRNGRNVRLRRPLTLREWASYQRQLGLGRADRCGRAVFFTIFLAILLAIACVNGVDVIPHVHRDHVLIPQRHVKSPD